MSKALRIVVVAVLAAALIAATALAAKPKRGGYSWASENANETVAFSVKGKKRKIVQPYVTSIGCNGGAPLVINKKIKVKPSGKFRFKGNGEYYDGSSSKVNFRGKFVTRKKAKGKVTIKSCDHTIEFTAKWSQGG